MQKAMNMDIPAKLGVLYRCDVRSPGTFRSPLFRAILLTVGISRSVIMPETKPAKTILEIIIQKFSIVILESVCKSIL